MIRKSKLVLPENPTLRNFQDYVAKMEHERGFDKETLAEAFMLFVEEIGEFAKAASSSVGLKRDFKTAQREISHEAADVFTYLLAICNKCNVDLEAAFRAKEEVNKKRNWK
jgi:NTP pyrophosphatase (non-canonical NTP hydrolase)